MIYALKRMDSLRRRWAPLTVAVVAVCAVASISVRSQAPDLSVAEALTLYAQGEFERAVEGRPFDGLTVATAIAALEAWIGPIDLKTATPDERAVHARREQVAARLAIDVAAHRRFAWITIRMPMFDGQAMPDTFSFTPSQGSPPFETQAFNAPIVVWACARLARLSATSGPVEPWEPGFWLASIALLQEAGEWRLLQGGVRGGHLADARRRLGAHPRMRLAEAVTRASALTDGRHIFGVMTRGRPDVLRHLEESARTMNAGLFTDAERDFEALLSEPGLEVEVVLRLAQLKMLRRDWPGALRLLDRASSATDDRVFRATADYFRGWIFERTDRTTEALKAYRAAHARYDTSPNLNTLFAAQLMMAGERAEAALVLERTVRELHNHTWLDLWWLMVEGDARKAQQYARQMREAQ